MRVPTGPDELTSEWLTKALRETGAISQASVTELDITPLDKAKSRLSSVVRLRLAYSVDEEGPGSFIAKFSHPDPETRTVWKGAYEREIRFYERVANRVGLRTPRCYHGDLNPEGGEHILLLEDLPSTPCGDLVSGCSAEKTEAAVVGVAKLHAPFWESPRLEEMDWLPQRNEAQLRLVQDNCQRMWGPFLEKVGHGLPDRVVETGEQLGENVVGLGNHLFKEPPQTLIHGDYHIDNPLFGVDADGGSGNSFAVVDWQLVRRGRGIEDVCSFACHSLCPIERLASEMDILSSYHMALMENGISDYSFDECLRDYRYSTLSLLIGKVFSIGRGIHGKDVEWRHLDSNIVLPRFSAAILNLNAGDLLPI